MTKYQSLLEDFEKSVARLREALQEEKTSVLRDASILRFELAFDLAWKTLKVHLDDKFGISVRSPKMTFREAFKQGVVAYDDHWIELVDDRNYIVHTYKEKFADYIYAKLPAALKKFEELLSKLKESK